MNKKLIAFLLLSIVLLPISVMAQSSAGTMEFCGKIKKIKDTILEVGVVLVAIAFGVAAIIYLTSAGSTKLMELGKTALRAAIIGTVILLLSGSAYELMKNVIGGSIAECK